MGQSSDNREASNALSQTLDALAIRAGAKERDLLTDYGTELVRWNRKINLTGASTLTDFFKGPLFDALTLIPLIVGSGSLVDVGSGGGLPGLPAAILFEHLKVTLVEPRARRAAFLRHTTHRMSLEINIIQARDEELVEGDWDSAVAQAVWPAGQWLKRARRLVGGKGAVYVLASKTLSPQDLPKGSIIEREFQTTRPFDGANRFAYMVR